MMPRDLYWTSKFQTYSFDGVPDERFKALPEDSPLKTQSDLSDFECDCLEDVLENYFEHGRFLVPMRRRKGAYTTATDESKLESFVVLWERLKLPADANFLLSRERIRSAKRGAVEQELEEAVAARAAIESELAPLRALVQLVTEDEPDLSAALAGNRALVMSSLRAENYVSEDVSFEGLEVLMRDGSEEEKSLVMRRILGELIGVQSSKTRESSWSEHKKRLKSALRWIPAGEDLQRMLDLEQLSELIPRLADWPLLDSSREFLDGEVDDLEKTLAELAI
jgi:hypothetical protein